MKNNHSLTLSSFSVSFYVSCTRVPKIFRDIFNKHRAIMSLQLSEKPKVSRIIQLVDNYGKMREILIQKVEEGKWEEAVEHMCTRFIADELMCSSLNVINDPESIDEFRRIWRIIVKQGLSVAAYDVTGGNADSLMVGVNMLYHANEEIEEIIRLIGASSSATGKIVDFIVKGYSKIDPQKLNSFGRHLEGYGISIDPEYRKLGLAQQMLNLRDELGKAYNFEYTTAIFTSKVSQKLADASGYELLADCPYDEALGDDGSPRFPKLKGMIAKIMGKRIN